MKVYLPFYSIALLLFLATCTPSEAPEYATQICDCFTREKEQLLSEKEAIRMQVIRTCYFNQMDTMAENFKAEHAGHDHNHLDHLFALSFETSQYLKKHCPIYREQAALIYEAIQSEKEAKSKEAIQPADSEKQRKEIVGRLVKIDVLDEHNSFIELELEDGVSRSFFSMNLSDQLLRQRLKVWYKKGVLEGDSVNWVLAYEALE